MNALLGIAVLGLAGVAAIRATSALVEDRLSRALAAATVFFAIFLGAFLYQGFIELASGRPGIGLPLAAAFVAACLGATLLWPRPALRPGPATVDDATARRWRTVPLVVAAFVTLVFVACGILLVLGGVPHGYEVKAYHLPLAIRVLRDGTLHLWDRSFMHAYPVNMSVWAGFFMVLVPERLVTIVNLPFLVLLATAVYGLGRAVGGDRSAALLVASGVATIPIIGFSALEIGADVAGVAFVAIATYMVIVRPGGWRFPWIAGLAAGMAYGFKSLHLVPAAALGLLLLLEGLVGQRRLASDRGVSLGAFAPVLAYSTAALAMMSFWLVRNAVEAGNPLYPVHVHGLFDLFGWKAAPDFDLRTRSTTESEWVDASWKWALYPWVEGNFVNQNFKHSSGLGAFFAATVPIVALVWPLSLFARRSTGPVAPVRAQAVAYGVAVVVVAAWCVLGDRQPRYVMAAIVLLCPIAAWIVTLATGRLRTRYEALLTVCIATMAFVLGVKMVATNGVTLMQGPHATRKDWLEYPAAIDRLPAGSVIANGVDREVDYLLLGEGLRNRVIDTGEVIRRFATADSTLRVTREAAASTGLTHLYVMADRAIGTDDCIALSEVDRLDRNPFNHQPFEAAHVLYRVDRLCGEAPR